MSEQQGDFGSLAATSPHPLGLKVHRAEGCYLYTEDGKQYLDLISGLAVNNIGHGNQEVVRAIKEQTDRYLHVIPYGEFVQRPQVEYAAALTSALPSGLDSVYFVNSGTEAIEASLKLAKRVTGRTGLIGCVRSYHGSTHGSLSITGNETKKFRNRPLLPDTSCIRFNEMTDLKMIGGTTAAVVVECVQGDAGVRVADPTWLSALRHRCTEQGVQLIFDEVQTGFGRTGSLFAFEHFGVKPDILVLGKALGGGLPMGAFISSTTSMALLSEAPILGHITTFGGHPLPCASGSAAFDYLINHKLIDNAEHIGALFEELLVHDLIEEVRRLGAMLAVELASADQVSKVVNGLLDEGFLGFWFLSCPEAFRLAPPLIMNELQIRAACEAIIRQLDDL